MVIAGAPVLLSTLIARPSWQPWSAGSMSTFRTASSVIFPEEFW